MNPPGMADPAEEHEDGDGVSLVPAEVDCLTPAASKKGLRVVRTQADAIRHGDIELKR